MERYKIEDFIFLRKFLNPFILESYWQMYFNDALSSEKWRRILWQGTIRSMDRG